jgi:osmoprotectant transport system permease protein
MSELLRAQLARQWEVLPERLGGHIFLTLTALAVGIVVSIPLGIWAHRRPRCERVALTMASIIQTIPGLALLALMVFLWGTIGWIPALIALILYSVLPMLRNTITGLHGLDPALIEAARGVGMNPWQMLRFVQLPLAAPVIVAGIRTASVWVVGAATIAQPVGAVSLGNYIFVGLQTSNFVSLAFGCVLSASLALLLDGLLHGLERAAAERSVARGVTMGIGLMLLFFSPLILRHLPQGTLVALPGRDGTEVVRDDDLSQRPYVVGSKAFTEQYIWADVIQRRLVSEGRPARVLDGMGSATVFQALASGQIDCYVDYTGTIWSNFMRQTRIVPPLQVRIEVASYLYSQHEIYCLGPLGFSNDYVFATRQELADEHQLQTLSDLAAVSSKWSAGMDIEFLDRPEWSSVRQAYQLDFARKVAMDSTLMYGAIADEQLDVIVAFNSDGRLDRQDLVVLADPAYALPPYDAVLLVSPRMARDAAAMRALRPLIEAIDVHQMRTANAMVDMDGRPVTEASDYVLSLTGNSKNTSR